MPERIVTRWFLRMSAPDQLAAAPPADPGLEVRRAEVPSPELSRFLYTAVGGDWYWIDRLGWNRDRWRAYVARPEVETWVGWLRGTPAGYAELIARPGVVEVTYFGLLRDFMGRGLGPRLLHAAVERAWALGPERVQLSTCTLDSPAAKRTYERAGFAVYDRREERVTLPDEPPGPWPGAGPSTAAPHGGQPPP